MIDSIKLVRRGKVRRAKLYYLRGLRGKKARIAEGTHHGGQSTDVTAERHRNSRRRAIAQRTRPARPAFFMRAHGIADPAAPWRSGCFSGAAWTMLKDWPTIDE